MFSDKQTKIVATIGPASDNPETVTSLIKAGVNVFRFNMKHATINWHHERINLVQKVADELGVPIGILIDLQGPEIRLETRDQNDIAVKKGERIVFGEAFLADDTQVVIPHPIVFEVLKPGDLVLVDDGFLEFTVVEQHHHSIVVEAHDDYLIKHRKGVNLPGKRIDLPSLIVDDLHKLEMAGKTKVDFVALSFSRTKKDIEVLREEMAKRNVNADIVAKIESQQAVDHIDELIEASDVIMVARGDLGIEVPIEELAYWQKTIISKCRAAKKPVITATQMLQSMVENPRPTRAEAVDVANAVFDGSDAVMLSAESASGNYPIRAVQHMARIARFAETKRPVVETDTKPSNTTELIIHAAVDMLKSKAGAKIDKAIVFTETGYTARTLASYRPHIPIVAVSHHRKTVEKLSLSYGVRPYCVELPTGVFALPNSVFDTLIKKEAIKEGETVLIIHGRNWQEPGLTNAIAVLSIR